MGGQLVSDGLRPLITLGAEAVHPPVADGDDHREIPRRVERREVLEGHDREALYLASLPVIAVEGHDLVRESCDRKKWANHATVPVPRRTTRFMAYDSPEQTLDARLGLERMRLIGGGRPDRAAPSHPLDGQEEDAEVQAERPLVDVPDVEREPIPSPGSRI